MGGWAIGLCLGFTVTVFGLHPLLMRRAGGSSGWMPSLGGSRMERLANLLFLTSCGLDLLGPALVIGGVLHPFGPADVPPVHAAGFILFALALPLAIVAQRNMGRAWRTGVDPANAAPLVTSGVFTVVRNPLYTVMLATSLGTALLVPSVISPPALAGCLLAIEVQARRVEEPFLERRHGESYRRYAAGVGRFLPVLGRLHPPA